MTRRRALGVLSSLLVLTVGACAGDPGAGDGWRRVEDGWVQVDVPAPWVATGGLTDRWTASWQDTDGDDATVQLAVSARLGHLTAAEGRGVVLAAAQLGGMPGFEIVEQSGPTAGERGELTRTDFRYTPAGGRSVEGVLWVASDPGTGRAVAVQLTGVDLDETVVEGIGSSIAVRDAG